MRLHSLASFVSITFLLASVSAPNASAATLLSPGHAIIGVAASPGGATSAIAVEGFTDGANNYPGGESPDLAIDGDGGTKYLNFAKTNTGFIVTIPNGLTTVTGFQFIAGNDSPERDPGTVTLEGAGAADPSTAAAGATWTLLYSGASGLAADPGRSTGGSVIAFANSAGFNTYRVLVTTVRDASTANSMQIGEVHFFGPDTTPPTLSNVLPVPGTVQTLSSVKVTFSEAVTGVDASDLRINGTPATGLSGSGATYTFTFAQPANGTVLMSWAAAPGIVDLAAAPNAFDAAAPGALWQYTLDPGAPAVRYPEAVLAAGPVAYWRLESANDASLSNAFITSFQGDTTVTASGGGVPLAGVTGNRAAVLDGNGDSITTGLDTEFQFASAGTFMAWVNFAQLPSAVPQEVTLMIKSQFESPLDFVMTRDDRLNGYGGNYPQVFYDANPRLATNTWYHLAFTFSNSGQFKRLHVNGVLVGDLPFSPQLTGSTNELVLGNSPVFTDRSLNGRLDEVAVFDRALSSAEIQSIFAAAGVAAPAPQPAIRVGLEFSRNRGPEQEGGWQYFGLGVNLNLSPNTFSATNLVASPHTNHWVRMGGPTGWLGGSGYGYGTLDEALQEATNGLWTLVLNEGSPTQQVYHFTVSVTNLSTNDFAVINITSPVDASTGNPENPAFTWTSTQPWDTNRVELSGATYGGATLPPGSTSWSTAPTLNLGVHDFAVIVATNGAAWVNISPALDAGNSPLAGWDAGSWLNQRRTIRFRVGTFTVPPPGLQAHLRFDDENWLGFDSSGQDNHAYLAYWGQLPTYNPNGQDGGAASFTYGGFLEFQDNLSQALGGNFTVAVWVKTTQSMGNSSDQAHDGAGIIWGKSGGQVNDTVPLAINDTKAGFMTGNPDETLHSTNDINTGNWVHVAVTRKLGSGEKAIYVNGVLDSTGVGNPNILDALRRISVGNGYTTFNGLLDDLQIYSAGLSASDIAFLYANPGLEVTNFNSLGDTLNAPFLAWNTGGDLPWFSQTSETHDGIMAAQSGGILDDQQSWVETSLTGPGTLTFWWRVSSEDGFDFLNIALDGTEETSITGDSGWLEQTLDIPAGLHVVRWTYTKDGSDSGGADAAWLDEASYSGVSNPIGDAVDAPQYAWTTSGNGFWFAQTNTTHDGIDAAQSGAISDNQQSDIQTTITGPKTVDFWWKTSCDYGDFFGGDYLAFIVDGSYYYDTISGDSDWSYNEYVIPPGVHNLRWRYSKDASGAAFLDTVWLDEVSISDNVAPQLTHYPVATNAPVGSLVTIEVQAYGNPPPDFQWYKNGQVIPKATNSTLALTNVQLTDTANYSVTASNQWGSLNVGAVVRIYVPTDLRPLTLSVPAVVNSQTPVPVFWTVTNTGPGSVANWNDGLYLYTTNGTMVGWQGYGSLPGGTLLPGGASYANSNMAQKFYAAGGNYLLRVEVDNFGDIIETNETNNSLFVPVTVINPDLQPVAFQASGPLVAGQPMQFTWTLVNNGPGIVQNLTWFDQFYVSTNAVWDANAIFVGSHGYAANLAVGGRLTNTTSLTLPVTPSGDYYLILRVAPSTYGYIIESTKTNNDYVLPAHLTVPDLVPTNFTAPAIASIRQPIPISWVDLNAGDGVASAYSPYFGVEWSDRLYFSTNDQIDASDIRLGIPAYGTDYGIERFDRLTPLAPGQSFTNSPTIIMPNVPEGNYYLIVRLDDQNYVRELNETNQILVRPITIASPDLTPSSLTAPAAAEARGTIQLTYTIENLGGTTAFPPWTDRVYLSSNATFEPGDTLLAENAANSIVAGGGSYTRTNSVTLPGVARNYFLLVYTDAGTNLFEHNEANNVRAMPINIGSPDLAVVSLDAPTNASSQQPITATFVITNLGPTVAQPGWGDRFYLSTNAALDGSALLLGNFVHSWPATLPAGGSYTQQVNITIPAVQAGDYFLLLRTDGADFFAEPNEANNLLALPLHLDNPDLIPTDFVVPVSVTVTQLSQAFELSWSVLNQGVGTTAAAWCDYIYLSRTNVLNANAVYLSANCRSAALAPGERYTVIDNLRLPEGIEGDFFLFMEADGGHQLYESGETNNLIVRPLRVTVPPVPDLAVASIQAPFDAMSGQEIEIIWVVTNRGGAAVSGTFRDFLYLATAANGAGAQFYGNFEFTGHIDPGQSIERRQRINLPQELSGNRWVLVQTDAANEIFEFNNEGNNGLVSTQPVAVRLSPTPNLAVTQVIAPTEAFSSQNTLIRWAVTNIGAAATRSPIWYDGVYLSADTNFGNDTYLGSARNASYLNPGDGYANSLTVTLPRGIEGNYYFIVRADTFNNVFENTNETDNVNIGAVTQVHLTQPPDLHVHAVLAPRNAFSGQSNQLSWTITNAGPGQTFETRWNDRVYLSTNTTISASDFDLGVFEHLGALESGSSYTTTNTVKLPVGVAGDWYFIVQSDIYNQVYEFAFEGNNDGPASFATTIFLTPPPDLVATSVAAPDSALASHVLSVAYRVANNGATETPNSSWTDRLYLSSDTNFNVATALTLASLPHYGAMNPGEAYTRTISAVLANDLTGTFYAFVVIDANNDVFELNNTNNLGFDPVPVVIESRPADLVGTRLTAPASVEAGASMTIAWAVANRGSGDSAVTRWYDRVVLSPDVFLDDGDDVELVNRVHDGLLGANGVYEVNNETVQIPITTFPGTYQLFLVADRFNQVYEGTNENNNVFGPIPIAISRHTADLAAVNLVAPGAAESGDEIIVQWEVRNLGDRWPNSSYWYDSVYLSTNATLNANDLLLGWRQSFSTLAPGGSYTNSLRARLPLDTEGTFYLIFVTDLYNQVVEGGSEANNQLVSLPLVITRKAVPDLAVTLVDAPAVAFSGQVFDLSWTVQNVGGAPANGPWYEAAYLSLDKFLDVRNDTYLGFAYRPQNLAPGQRYTNSTGFEIPPGLSGPFYVFVSSDSGKAIYERNLKENNIAFDPQPMDVQLLPPVDLVAGPITIPANAAPGRNASVTFTIYNQGTNAARGSWEDALYISADTNWDVGDAFFGRVRHTGNIGGGSNYSATLTAPLPGVLPGDYHVIIRSDIFNHLIEADEVNNLGASLDAVNIDSAILVMGTPDSDALAEGQSVFYRFQATAGQTVRIRFTSGATLSGNELYVRYGQMPTRGEFDFAINEPFVSDPDLIIPIEHTGMHYLLAYSSFLLTPASYTILAEILPFSVVSATPTAAGNVGGTTFKVRGALFDSATQFELVRGSNVISATRAVLEDSANAFVNFHLFATELGSYDLRARLGTNALVTANLSNAVFVVKGRGPVVSASFDGPLSVWAAFTQSILLGYGNSGDADTMAPLLLVYGRDGTLVGTTRENLGLVPLHLLGRSLDGPPEVLRPQTAHSHPLFYRGGALTVETRPVLADNTNPILDSEWSEIESSIRPAGLADPDWLAFWSNVRPRIGSSWGDYVRFLNDLASAFPPEMRDVRQMFTSMVATNPNFRASSFVSGRVLDAEDGSPRAGVEIALYRASGKGGQLGGRTVTAGDGGFALPNLVPGTYDVVIISEEFDMNRDGLPDTNAPALAVTRGSDLAGQDLYLWHQPPATNQINDAHAALALDSQGALQAVWLREEKLWHARQQGGQWIDAQSVTTNIVGSFVFAAAANLLDGASPGLIAAWDADHGVRSDLYYAVAQPQGGGAYAWSQPVRLTQDAARDTSPSLLINDQGQALIVWLKQSATVPDDADVYYSVVEVASGQLLRVGSTAGLHAAGTTNKFGTKASVQFSKDIKKEAFGYVVGAGIEFQGEGSALGCEIEGKAAARGKLSLEEEGKFGLTFKGGGDFTVKYQVHPERCKWEMVESTANVGFEAELEIKNAVFRVLRASPNPLASRAAAKLEGGVDWLRENYGIRLENSVAFGVGVDFKNLHWNKTPPFPSWVMPDYIGSSEFKVSAALQLLARLPGKDDMIVDGAVFTPAGSPDSNTEAKAAGKVEAVWELFPKPRWKSLTGTVGVSCTVNGWELSSTPIVFSLESVPEDVGGLAPASAPGGFLPDGWTFRYNPARALGTASVYGTNSLLANVAADLYRDGQPSLARDAAGVSYAVWFKDGDPLLPETGSELYVADFNGATWSAPAVIPGSKGFNSQVNTTGDSANHRLAVWVHADASAITTHSTAEQFFGARGAADLFYSIHDGTAWSAPQRVTSTVGRDTDLHVSRLANGDVLVVWTASEGGTRNSLLAARWNGAIWSAPELIAFGAINSPVAQQAGGETFVLWTQVTGTNNSVALESLFQSRSAGTGWSAPEPFAPLDPAQAGPAPAASLVAAEAPPTGPLDAFFALFNEFPDHCCACEGKGIRTEGKNRERGPCTIGKRYDAKDCVEYIYYAACPARSSDPNDIVGPPGFGPEQWVPGGSPLTYTIRFENNALTATAPAKEVIIRQTLDDDIDPRTFRLGSFGFGDLTVPIPENRAFYNTRLDFTATRGFYLDFIAGVDVARRELFWRLSTIDPAMGDLPVNPLLGFLPPNNTPPEGEGFVTYSVRPNAGPANGTRVDASATIIFDTEAPIDTPAIFNNLETGTPGSAVRPLAATSDDPVIPVEWSGADEPGGSGLAGYDLYVSVDGSDYKLWIGNTTLTNSLYSGQSGSRYAFYSVARDNAGNVEALPATPDAEILVASQNTAPVVPLTPDQLAVEQIPFTLQLIATDADLPTNTLTFEMVSGPTGAVVNATSGLFSWTPSEAQGPGTNVILFRVSDDGTPSLNTLGSFTMAVTEMNRAPAPALVDQTIDEEQTLDFFLPATDPDLPANTLIFAVLGTLPTGANLEPLSGRFTWTPTELQGPQTNPITIRVTDHGVPPMSATQTFAVVVREVNRSPVLDGIAQRFATLLTPVVVTNHAADADLPVNQLTFSLGAGAPASALLDPATGLFRWTPPKSFAGTTNPITILVTDDGEPPRSASQTFSVVVEDYLELSIGSAVVKPGETSSVPIRIFSSAPMKDPEFVLEMAAAQLDGLSLSNLTAGLAAGWLTPLNPDHSLVVFSNAPAQLLQGDQMLAQLRFIVPLATNSSVVPLSPSGVSARRTDGSIITRTFTTPGRVIVVKGVPLLDAVAVGNGRHSLTLYGEPGRTYFLETTTVLTPPIVWTPAFTITLSNLVQTIEGLTNSQPVLIYRARE